MATLVTILITSAGRTMAQQTDSLQYNPGSPIFEKTTIGGYGEIHYSYDTESKDARVNLSRFVIFFGHSFSERISFKSELEVEDAKVAGGEEGGEVALEQAYLDFLISPSFGLRAGLFIPAIGIINETHEPPTFNGVERPYLETNLIPATWREIGVGVFGRITAVDGLSYKFSLVNGLRASGFGGSEGIREGRFEGRDANANSLAVTGKLEYVVDGLKLGGAVYYGGTSAGDTLLAKGPFGAPMTLVALDAQYNYRNFYFRGVGASIQIPDAGNINSLYGSDIGESLLGGYAEVAYDIMPHLCSGASSQLLPFVRYETFDLHSSVAAPLIRNDAYDQTYVIAGLTYKPIYNVVVKGDYTLQRNKANAGETNFVRLGIGYSF
jgi:hypothetical protein